jgi:hypothetical protein
MVKAMSSVGQNVVVGGGGGGEEDEHLKLYSGGLGFRV